MQTDRGTRGTRGALAAATTAEGRAAVKILAAIALFAAFGASANPAQIVDGNYLRYEGSEYESMFFPCQTTEVWSINGGIAFDALVDYYRNARTGTSGEIRTVLMLDVLPIHRTEHPGSQIDAVTKVMAIVSISEAENEVSSCREGAR